MQTSYLVIPIIFCTSLSYAESQPTAPKQLTVRTNVDYYSWKGDDDSKGHQVFTPLTINYRYGNAEFGLRTAHVSSSNETPTREGHVSSFTDLALSAAYVQKLDNALNIRYNLDYNAPTGKASLEGKEKNAIMDGNLVGQTRFGEGHNVTPGIVVTKAFTPNFSLGGGVSRTFRGSYDPNADIENDELNPGDETRVNLQGQYSNQKLTLLGGAIYTHSGTTTVDDKDYFKKGARYDLNLTGIYALPYQQSVTAGIRYSKQRPDTYINRVTGNFEKEERNINGSSVYLNLGYNKAWQQHSFNASADWLKINANSYDQFNDLYNAGREKYSLGLGYGYQFAPNGQVSLSMKRFWLKDKATPATVTDTKYDGWNVGAGVKYSF